MVCSMYFLPILPSTIHAVTPIKICRFLPAKKISKPPKPPLTTTISTKSTTTKSTTQTTATTKPQRRRFRWASLK